MGIYRVGFFSFPLLRQPRGECLHGGLHALAPSAMWVLDPACRLACMLSACMVCNCKAASLVAGTCTCRCALHSTASSFAFRHPESAGRHGAAGDARHAERRAAHHLGCVAACSAWCCSLSAQRTVALAAWPTSPDVLHWTDGLSSWLPLCRRPLGGSGGQRSHGAPLNAGPRATTGERLMFTGC